MARKKQRPAGSIQNRRARFDYELGDSLLVGISLTGRETKALRLGRGQLQGAYVTAKSNELWLINAQVHGTNGIIIEESEMSRARKLLAKRREIDALIAAKQQGRTIVPTEILTKGRFIKLKIALGKGKKNYDKRNTIKKREQDKEARRQLG